VRVGEEVIGKRRNRHNRREQEDRRYVKGKIIGIYNGFVVLEIAAKGGKYTEGFRFNEIYRVPRKRHRKDTENSDECGII